MRQDEHSRPRESAERPATEQGSATERVAAERDAAERDSAVPEGSSRGGAPDKVDRWPRPRLSRVGRGAVALAMVAVLFLLLVLTLRYSRQSMETTLRSRPEIPGPPPTEVEQIERYRPPQQSEPEPPVEVAEEVAEGAPVRLPVDLRGPAGPSRELRAALRSPLITGRPPRVEREEAGRSGGRESEGFGGAAGLPSLEELERQLRGLGSLELSGAGARSPGNLAVSGSEGRELEASWAGSSLAGAGPLGAPRQRNLLPSSGRSSSAPLRVHPTPPASPFLLQAGTYLPAVMAHRVVSDQPGLLRAVVSRDVYDSLAGRHLLLPRGTVLLGHQDELPVLGQRRLAVLWSRARLPDGRTLELGAAAPAAGLDGSAGVPGRVRQHWGRRYGAAVLLSLVGAGVQLSQPQGDRDRLDPGQIAAGSLGLELGRLSQRILQQYADLPPTIELVPGARLHVVLIRDLAFPAPYGSASPAPFCPGRPFDPSRPSHPLLLEVPR